MQLSNAPGKLTLPFANAGAKNTIPVASQIGITAGAASLTDGFPPLTRTPIAAGGVPPSGLDMNGILYALSATLRWANAGGGYVYDGTFATDSNIAGYPKGARVLRSDGAGYWLNTIDGNTVDPESVTVNQAQIAGWVPDLTNGVAAVTMTSANVTLTPLQYGKPIIVLSGTLTANLNLIFPNLAGEWTVINNCAGAFTVTVKTATGTGIVVTPGRTRIVWGNGTNVYSAVNESETPPQFDATTKLATMAALQLALGNYQAFTAFTTAGTSTLTAADAGKEIVLSGSLITANLVLPLLSTLPNGAAFLIKCEAYSSTWTIAPNATDGVALVVGSSAVSSLVIKRGDYALIVKGGTAWRVHGTISLAYGDSFAYSVGSNGYQKLPTGIIRQFGVVLTSAGATTAVTLPTSFPTACTGIRCTPSVTNAQFATVNGAGLSSFNIDCWNTAGARQASNVYWEAEGY